MSEYQIDIRIKNGLILQKIKQQGYESLAAFCRATTVCLHSLHQLLAFKRSPLDTKGNYRPIVYKLCETLNCVPEELFTAQQMDLELKSNKRTLLVNEAEMRHHLERFNDVKSLEDQRMDEQLHETLNNTLEQLTAREQKVLDMRFGLTDGISHTLEEIGINFGVNRERIRQIEAKALRKLRNPNFGGQLREFIQQ
jgi:RNA polymerase primary sigma factor